MRRTACSYIIFIRTYICSSTAVWEKERGTEHNETVYFSVLECVNGARSGRQFRPEPVRKSLAKKKWHFRKFGVAFSESLAEKSGT